MEFIFMRREASIGVTRVHWPSFWLGGLGHRDTEGTEAEGRRWNLTILTQELNSAIANSAFEIKKPEILRNSALALNRYFQDKVVWDDAQIVARGESLFQIAIEIWPYPKTA